MRSPGTSSSIVGVEQATVRRRCVPGARDPVAVCARRAQLVMGVVLLGLAPPLRAQAGGSRVEQVHRAHEPEGRLLTFYSAAMLFTSLGATATPGRWSLGVEATFIPALSEAQRRPGIDKPEATNLSPVLPRPRVALRAGDTIVEGSWIPPLAVGDARANLAALAVSHPMGQWRGLTVVPRLSVVTGRVRGAITCNARAMQGGGPDLATYYAAVCHGRDSDDWFEPRLVAGEVIAQRDWGRSGRTMWLAAGGRLDRSRFDIGVQRPDGTRDLDHPRLRLEDARMHLTGGVRWSLGARLATATEAFYAPGSMLTVRALLALTPRGR
jgi:hypothetical protein